MTYLSRVELNPQKRKGRLFLSNPRVVHAAVMAAFPPSLTEDSGSRILWRVDQQDPQKRLYVVSPDKPDLTHIAEQAGWEGYPGSILDYDRFLERLENGQSWGFRLTANVVKSEKAMGQRGKIVPLAGVDAHTDWLVSRADYLGADLVTGGGEPSFTVSGIETVRFSRPEPHEGGRKRSVTLRRVQFDGNLRIHDAERLRDTLMHGIGRAKAFGCGLLTLRPPDVK